MNRKLSRRDVLKIAGAGTAAGVLGATLENWPHLSNPLDEFARTASAQSGYIARRHGVVLTNASTTTLQNCISYGGYDTLKVLTGWGMTWTASNISYACSRTPVTIVRTKRGDGSGRYVNGSPDITWAFPVASNIVSEIQPWYAAKPTIAIELGNEPNGDTSWLAEGKSDDFIWNWRFHLNQAIDACQSNFPQAPLISPGLATLSSTDMRRWFNIAGDVMRRCDFIGFHAYATCDFYGSDLSVIIPLMQEYFPNHLWALTEYGINGKLDGTDCNGIVPSGPYTSVTDRAKYEKGRRYANLVHFGGSSPQLPSNVWSAQYFHLNTSGQSYANERYHIYAPGDHGYKSRTG